MLDMHHLVHWKIENVRAVGCCAIRVFHLWLRFE